MTRGPLAAIVDVVRRRLGDDLLRDVAHEAARAAVDAVIDGAIASDRKPRQRAVPQPDNDDVPVDAVASAAARKAIARLGPR